MYTYEGTIKSAVYSPDLTEKWGELHGGLGYTLHVFIDLINNEPINNVMKINKAVIEMNVYSNIISERYHYKDLKTGMIKTSYLKLLSPFVIEKGKKLSPCDDVAIDEEVTQRVSIWSLSKLMKKKHKKLEGYYRMSDGKTLIYKVKKPHIRDLWLAEDIIDSCSSKTTTRDSNLIAC